MKRSQTLDSSSSPRIFRVVEEEAVDPALARHYEEGIALFVEAMRRAQVGPELNWVASKHGQTYYYVFTIASLEDLDPQAAHVQQRTQRLMEAVGEKTVSRFMELVAPAIRGNQLYVLEPVENYSFRPTESVVKDPKYVFIEIHRLRADMIDQYDQVMERFIEAVRRIDHPLGWSAYRTITGDGRPFHVAGRTYYYISPYDSKSQFYEEHWFGAVVEQALGTEGAKQLGADMMKCLVGLETFDHSLRSDLSYQADQEL